MKKNKIIFAIVLSLILIAIVFIFLNHRITTEEAILKLNEEVYSFSIDLDNKTANVDGESVKISDLLSVKESEVDTMITENTLESFLKDNLTGDIKINGTKISVDNPYSTKSLIVETTDEDLEKNYDGIVSKKKIVDDIYLVRFKDAVSTKADYLDLKDDEKTLNVLPDIKVKTLDNYVAPVQSVNPSYVAWGVAQMGMDHYTTKLNNSNNDSTIKVAILDTGIYSNHEVFNIPGRSNLINTSLSYNYVGSNTDVSDDSGHGTMVAGVITEATSNNVEIIPIKTNDSTGHGNFNDIIDALDNIYTQVDVANLSLGFDGSLMSNDARTIYEKAFKKYRDAGLVVVAATGNESSSVFYPASSAYTIAAGSIDQSQNISSFSNYGSEVDFVAPGDDLTLPYNTGSNTYVIADGTSFSCPFIVSAVAMVKADNPDFTFNQIYSLLQTNAIDLGDTGKDIYYGYGAVTFNKAMFNKPVFANVSVQQTSPSLINYIDVFAVCDDNITKYAITKTNATPSNWSNVSQPSNTLNTTLNVSENGTYYIWAKDSTGDVSVTTIDITLIGTQISVDNRTNNLASVTLGGQTSNSNFSAYTSDGNIIVECQSPCKVVLSDTNESFYTKLTPQSYGTNSRKFSFDINSGNKIIIVPSGDINCNGIINLTDVVAINRACLSPSHQAYEPLTDFQMAIADINNNGTVNTADSTLILRSIVSESHPAFKALDW